MTETQDLWRRAALTAAILAVDAVGLRGVVLSGRTGPVRDAWLDLLARLHPGSMRRMPPAIDDERLFGGLDLAATLSSGKLIQSAGLLAEAEDGLLVIPMAERMSSALAGRLSLALDDPSRRFGLVLLEEPVEPGEAAPDSLADRMALHIDLSSLTVRDIGSSGYEPQDIIDARLGLARVTLPDEAVPTLTRAAAGLGIASLRPVSGTLRAARALAALEQRSVASTEDVALAAAIVLAPRALLLEESGEEPEPPAPSHPDESRQRNEEAELEDRVQDAVRSALPADLLDHLAARSTARGTGSGAGTFRRSVSHGRPLRPERGRPEGQRLDIIATLNAAAPWQKVRRRERPRDKGLIVERDDFRVRSYAEPSESVLIFVVDASGSTASARLAEAKGAVELMLSQAYRRREKVALIAFRGKEAELLLPPTRSLVQARRRLAVLPGGGGTPLASALLAAHQLATQLGQRGATPFLVLLTDGRGNIGLDGKPDRKVAADDTARTATAIRAGGLRAVLVDTASRPQTAARDLSQSMGAHYLALPHADAARMNLAVRLAVDA